MNASISCTIFRVTSNVWINLFIKRNFCYYTGSYSKNCHLNFFATSIYSLHSVLFMLPTHDCSLSFEAHMKLFQHRCFSCSTVFSAGKTDFLCSFKTKMYNLIVTKDVSERRDRSENVLHKRYIYVQTSGARWEDIPGGLIFDVGYLDSAPDEKINTSVPLVLFLHTTPGSAYDMQPVLETLVKAGCRVLAPGFPGCGDTVGIEKGYDEAFMHSTSEKAEFIKDFLLNINVQRVDILLGEGGGCVPAMKLIADDETCNMFHGVAMISPWPHKPFRGSQQAYLQSLISSTWERPFYRPLARCLSWFLYRREKTESFFRVMLARTLLNLRFAEIGGFAVAIDIRNIPCLMMIPDKDYYVENGLSLEMASLMGIDSHRIHHISGQLEAGHLNTFPSCLVFENAGDDIRLMYRQHMCVLLLSFLKSIRPTFSSF